MSELQSQPNKVPDAERDSAKKDESFTLKTAAKWGMVILASAGIGTAIREVRSRLKGDDATATSVLSTTQKESVSKIISTLIDTQGVSLAAVKAAHPAGYLEEKIRTLTANEISPESFGEFTAIGKPAIPFIEAAALRGSLPQSEVLPAYITLGEIGGNEAASSILRIFTERSKGLSGYELTNEMVAVGLSVFCSNSELGDTFVKELLAESEKLKGIDSLKLKELAVASISNSERASLLDEVASIVSNQSYPLPLRTAALNSMTGNGMNRTRVEREVLSLLKDKNDPLYQRALILAGNLARPEALPYLVEIALSNDQKTYERVNAIRAIGSLGAQKYATDLINVLSTKDSALSSQILETVVSIGTPNDINQVIKKCSGSLALREQFPFQDLSNRLSESPRMASACRESLNIVLHEVFQSNSKGQSPAVWDSFQAIDLFEKMVASELREILSESSTNPQDLSYPKITNQYREALAQRVFESSNNGERKFGLISKGTGLLAPFASKEALRAVELGTLGFSETNYAVQCLALLKDPSINAELTRIAAASSTENGVRRIISDVLAPQEKFFFKRTKPTEDPTPPPSSEQADEPRIDQPPENESEDLSSIVIPPLGIHATSEDDFFSTPIKEALDTSLAVAFRTQSLQRIIVLQETQSKELLPLLTDPAESIRIAAACSLAKRTPRSSFSESEASAIDNTLMEGLKRYLQGDYSRILSPISKSDIEDAVLEWKSPAVTEFLCAQLDEAQGMHRDIPRLLNPLLNSESDFTTFIQHAEKKVASLPPDDTYAQGLTKRMELLHGARAIGLAQPFRFSDKVLQTIIHDMQPSKDNKRPVVILCFAEADHNQAATAFNRQIEEIIAQGFRVLVMEPGSRSELESNSIELKKLLDESGLAGASHIFQFGHGQTEYLSLSEGEDESESNISARDTRGLPSFSTLLAPGGGVTLLSCSTGGQISGEDNLLSYYRKVIFPQAAEGHVRAPVLPTHLSGIILQFGEGKVAIDDVAFPVQTNEL